MNSNKKGFFSNLKNDFPASIVVFLVALPLCLGIALASGAPLFSGVIAGIIGGIVVALLSGSPLGVSGPAAGLAAIVLTAIPKLGFETFLFAVVIAGFFQLILGYLKAGVIGYYFPSAVIKGMLSGIGIFIVLKQIPYALGFGKGFEPIDFFTRFNEISPGAVFITIISLAILIIWEQPFMKKISIFKIIQGPLVVVALGIVLNLLFQGSQTFGLASDQLVSIPVPDSLDGFFNQFTFPDFTQWNNSQVYIIAVTIAVVASLETLLCVEATDKLDPNKEITPTNRELKAQGVGNILSGLIGGLPITQVIVRSSANIQSGGKSKASAFFHGILLLLSVMTIPKVLNLIPLSGLSAILFVVGFKLAKPSVFKQVYKLGKSQFVPFIITILGIIFADLLIGIGLGLALAIFHILYNNYKTPYHFDPETYKKGEPIIIELSEDVSFLNKGSILQTLNHLPDDAEVFIDGSKAKGIHPDVIEIIEDFKLNAAGRNITIHSKGFGGLEEVNPVKVFEKIVDKKV